MSLSLFQAAKSGNNGLGSVIESSGSQLIEVVSWSMICFLSELFKSLGDWLTLTLDILKRKFTTQPHLWKAQGSSADQSWCGKTRWKWRTTGLSASEWVHSARESDGWQGGGGMVTIGQGMNQFFSSLYTPSLFCGWPYKQGIILHSLITTHQSGGYSFVDDFEVRNSRLTVCLDRRPFAQLHMSTTISSDHCWWKMQSLSCC